jgi:spore maturation protein CgeB
MYGGSLPIAGYIEKAFRNLGHSTLFVDNSAAWSLYQATNRSLSNKGISNQLVAMLTRFLGEWSYARVTQFGADICLVIAQAPVGPDFPARLARDGIVSAFWFMENWRHLTYWRDISKYYDHFFHIQPGEFEQRLTEAGCRSHSYLQTACDRELHTPITLTDEEAVEYGCDISFAGAGYYNRVNVLSALTDYKFKIWGVDWPTPELQNLVQHSGERFDSERFRRIVAGSKINLNLHASMHHPGVDPKSDAINPRVFEIAACGGFQLCDPCIGLEQLYDFGTELPVYHDVAELRAQIDHFLANPEERTRIAQRARERVLGEHTYEHRAQQILDTVLAESGNIILRKGVRLEHTCGDMPSLLTDDDPELLEFLKMMPPGMPFTQEGIADGLSPTLFPSSYAAGVFAYLREVKSYAEALIEARES